MGQHRIFSYGLHGYGLYSHGPYSRGGSVGAATRIFSLWSLFITDPAISPCECHECLGLSPLRRKEKKRSDAKNNRHGSFNTRPRRQGNLSCIHDAAGPSATATTIAERQKTFRFSNNDVPVSQPAFTSVSLRRQFAIDPSGRSQSPWIFCNDNERLRKGRRPNLSNRQNSL